MNAFRILTLLGIVGLGFCQTAVPSFAWLEDGTSPNGVPLLSISFNDGGADDVAILKQFNPIRRGPDEREEDIDRCIFDGHLRDESEVRVVLTGGCPFEDTFEIQFKSSRLSGSMFRVVEGSVITVHPILRSDYIFRALAEEDEEPALPTAAQPNEINFKIKMIYDDSFRIQFGSDAVNEMRRVAAHMQPVFDLPGLPTRVRVNVVGEMGIAESIWAEGGWIDYLGYAYNNDGGINVNSYLCNRNDGSPAMGLAVVNSVCKDVKIRTSITEYYDSSMYTGRIMAHELGHTLGLGHDDHYDSHGNQCSGILGVMGSDTVPDKWTTCSYEDFVKADHSCF